HSPDDDELALVPEREPVQAELGHYFQTYYPVIGYPHTLDRSDTLAQEQSFFRLDEEARKNADALAPGGHFDDVELKRGVKLRRVTVRTVVSWGRRPEGLPSPPMPPPGGPKMKGPAKDFRPQPRSMAREWPLGRFKPVLYIQYARDTLLRERQLGELAQN